MVEFFCVAVILLTSPLDTENNPLNKKEKKSYKRVASSISILLFLISILCIFIGYRNFGCSIICGVAMSTLVLLMRKFELFMKRITK